MSPPPFSALPELKVLVRGGGDLASAAARRLLLAGLHVVVLELPQPLVVRRRVAFAAAVHEGEAQVMEVRGVLADRPPEARPDYVTVIVDPGGATIAAWQPDVLLDARMRKRRPTDLALDQAPLVIALGPGPVATEHCHAVIETQRGHRLGRVYWEGPAAAYTGVPGTVDGRGEQRVVRAPCAGRFTPQREIGDAVQLGTIIGEVSGAPAICRTSGVLRGVLFTDTPVSEGTKVGDVDPRGQPEYCYEISDKANAVAGGVIEALLTFLARGR